MKKGIIKYGIIAGISLVLATAIFLIIFFNRNVVVPDVTGKNLTEATQMFKKVGFKFITSFEYSDTVLKENVISQEIEGGEKVKYGSEIALVVSKGKEPITLPDLIDRTVSEAEDALKKLAFSVIIEEEFSKKVPKGNVISQSVPAGKQAYKGSIITLIVSKGPDLVTVPNIKGMTLEEAEQTLNAAGLKIRTGKQFSNSVEEGYIISQDVEENKQIDRHSFVKAIISLGAANTEGTTPSNANSFGRVTSQGNWIYFCGNDRQIYRMRKDKSEIQRIYSCSAICLNVVGEWIYFVDGTVGGIHKVRIDGTGKTQISSTTSYKVYVDGDWIYYTSQYWGGKIYKMKTDGTMATKITNEDCTGYIVKDGYIYYVNSDDSLVYKCRTDGKGKTILCVGFGGTDLSLVGEKLVIANGYDIQSVNLDGSGFNSFGISNVQYVLLNGCDGWVYYLRVDFRKTHDGKAMFGRMKPNGSKKTDIFEYQFLNHANSYLNVVDDWIYFQNEHEGDVLYRIKVDGTKVERVG